MRPPHIGMKQLGNSQLHQIKHPPPCYSPHTVTARICTTNVLSLLLIPGVPLSVFFLSFYVINLSLLLPPCLASSVPLCPPLQNTLWHDSFRRVHLVQSGLSMRPLPSSVSLWRCGNGRRLDKWDSAVLLLIIMPRLSLTDTRDLSSATQTCISPLAAQCVDAWVCICRCVRMYVCVRACMKDMLGILPYPALLRSRCLVYAADRYRQAISDTLAQAYTHACDRWELTNTQYLIHFRTRFSSEEPFSFRIRAKALSSHVWDVSIVCISSRITMFMTIGCWVIGMLIERGVVIGRRVYLYNVCSICFCPTGAGETHSWCRWQD